MSLIDKNKQKDSSARFVQVHTCHVLIDMPFDSHKQGKVEGWVGGDGVAALMGGW